MKLTQELPDIDVGTALVTGSSRGIGLAVAAALLAAGRDVIGVARTAANPGFERLRATASRHGRSFAPVASDLSQRDEVHALLAQVRELGPIDVLVHAAGINRRGSVRSLPTTDWDAVLSINLDAGFLLARELGDQMAALGRGHIVFLASMLSFQGGMAAPAYAASKGAVAQLTKAFANELAPLGVSVNAVAPGYIRTEMNAALIDDPDRDRAITERIPVGRWGTPEDIADVCAFLTTPAARYIHGAVIPVDGGWLAR